MTRTIDQQAAIALAHGLIAQTSRGDLRYLVIKGPGAQHLGLRPRRTAADVDLLLHPDDIDEMLGRLGQRGWAPRPSDPQADDIFPQHSVTLIHPQWSCDIDVHHYFPGFENDPGTVFDVLWENRVEFPIGGFAVHIPGSRASEIVLALHALRSPWLMSSQAELDYMATLNTDRDFSDLVDIAVRTGAVGALIPYLEKAYPEEDLAGITAVPSREWIVRTSNTHSGSIRILALIDAPWHQKPLLLWNALFPSRDALAAMDLTLTDAETTEGDLNRTRLQRIQRFFREVPEIIRDVLVTKRKLDSSIQKAGTGQSDEH